MSFFSWFRPKSAALQNSELPADELTARPLRASSSRHPTAAPSDMDLKAQRQDRREQLYTVVRDAMLRSGVLAASYKFKVLSLDNRGRQFLIMVDLLNGQALPGTRFMELEHLIVAIATQQYDLQVKAVYWRVYELPTPSPVESEAKTPEVASAQPRQAERSQVRVFEPIGQDEMLAFKQAVAAGSAAGEKATKGQMLTSGPRHASTPSGFEDTLLLEPDDAVSPLSKTQFGDL